jgi:hypothetical protein
LRLSQYFVISNRKRKAHAPRKRRRPHTRPLRRGGASRSDLRASCCKSSAQSATAVSFDTFEASCFSWSLLQKLRMTAGLRHTRPAHAEYCRREIHFIAFCRHLPIYEIHNIPLDYHIFQIGIKCGDGNGIRKKLRNNPRVKK